MQFSEHLLSLLSPARSGIRKRENCKRAPLRSFLHRNGLFKLRSRFVIEALANVRYARVIGRWNVLRICMMDFLETLERLVATMST